MLFGCLISSRRRKLKVLLSSVRKINPAKLIFSFLTFRVMFRDCDAEAFGAAAAQSRTATTGVCRISALAWEAIY